MKGLSADIILCSFVWFLNDSLLFLFTGCNDFNAYFFSLRQGFNFYQILQ